MSFSSLGLAPSLINAVTEIGYQEPTAIQSAAIPAILRGEDVLGAAQTGSGKTAAFALPLLQSLLDNRNGARQLHGLILVPTRELAAQVGESIRKLVAHLPMQVKVSIVFGGVSINPQMMALRGGADIVIATPGRLLDLIDHNALKISRTAILVLDEADRLLDLGFSEELNRILELLPKQRQNLFFSATFPPEVQALADGMLHQPARIEVLSEPVSKPDIAQRAIMVDVPRRTMLLKHLIQEHKWSRVLVFVATKYAAEHVADKLNRNGIRAGAFHGEFSQGRAPRCWATSRPAACRCWCRPTSPRAASISPVCRRWSIMICRVRRSTTRTASAAPAGPARAAWRSASSARRRSSISA